MNDSWISLHRKIKKHWVWKQSIYLKMWIDFIMRANYKPNKLVIEGELVEIARASFVTSLKKLAKEYGVSIGKIRRFLKLLESDSMIMLKTTHKYTQITICNYDIYQDSQHTNGNQTEIKRKSNGNQTETENNNNNDNKENNYNKEPQFSENSIEFSLSQLLYDLMLKNNPKAKKPNLDIWAKHIGLMLRVDERGADEIEGAIRWSQQNSFWQSNILSTKKLREKYDQLFLQAKREKKSGTYQSIFETDEFRERARAIAESIANDPDLK